MMYFSNIYGIRPYFEQGFYSSASYSNFTQLYQTNQPAAKHTASQPADITDTLENYHSIQKYIPVAHVVRPNSYVKNPLYYRSKYVKSPLDPEYEMRKHTKDNYKHITKKDKQKKKTRLQKLLELVN